MPEWFVYFGSDGLAEIGGWPHSCSEAAGIIRQNPWGVRRAQDQEENAVLTAPDTRVRF